MKITYLSDSTVPSCSANSIHVMKMCNALGAQGHDVTLFAYLGEGTRDVYRYYGVSPCFEIAQIWHSSIPGVRRLLRAAGGFVAHRRFAEPDLIYGRDLYSVLAASASGLPIIYESHVAPRSPSDRYLTGRLLSAANLRRLVVISGALARDYFILYPWLDPKRLLVAHDGADAPGPGSLFKPVGWPGRQLAVQVGYVGSLYPGKGAEIVVELARRLPNIDFHVVGGKRKEIERLRAGFHGTNLHMHGYVEHCEVQKYLAGLDVALLPAQKHVHLSKTLDIGRWMSPLKLFEYMASNVPIVASRLPVVKEVLEHNVNAILVPPGDLDSWAEAVDSLASNPNLRRKLAAHAYADLIRGYTWSARSYRVLQSVGG